MAASRSPRFTCTACGATHLAWVGRCDGCERWGTVEAAVGRAARGAVALATLNPDDLGRHATGLAELDRVLGGGLVEGSVTLLAGEPGIGKSTLALQVLAAASHGPAVLVAGEESAAQVASRAARLGLDLGHVTCVATRSLEEAIEAIGAQQARSVVVDSVQTMGSANAVGSPGSVGQVREATEQLVALAKRDRVSVLLLGHVTKDGQPGGPRTLEHLVDTVLLLEGDRVGQARSLHALKHRFGPTGELGVLELSAAGLGDAPDAGAQLLADRYAGPGSVLVATLAGSRARVVEVQALVSAASAAGRRSATGLEAARLGQVLGVLEQRAGIQLGSRDLYCSAAGGGRLTEPAADLAIALAIAGAAAGVALPPDLVAVGELGLMGELRRVERPELRVAEAKRLGLGPIVLPRGSGGAWPDGVVEVAHLGELFALAAAWQPAGALVASG